MAGFPPLRHMAFLGMMTMRNFGGRSAAHIIILGLLSAAQITFLLLPAHLVMAYLYVCRPIVYAGIVTALCVFVGSDAGTGPRCKQASMAVGLCALLYVVVGIITGLLFGFGNNAMVPGFSALLNNIWIYATIAVMSEVLRLVIIKGTPASQRPFMAVALTLVYTFTQLDTLRGAVVQDASGVADLFFADIFPVLVLNSVLSFIAYEGSLRSLLGLRCAYSLFPVILPVLPSVSRTIWSLISCSTLFFTALIYHRVTIVRDTSDQGARFKRSWETVDKRRKKFILAFALPAALAVLLLSFILRAFAYYPVAVLTDSMKGAIDQGSVVFVQKLRQEDVYGAVKAGDIIQYRYRNVEVMHRVTECRLDAEGERVYITMGDANPAADTNPVAQEQVLGIARAYIPYIGYPFVIIGAISNG